MSEFMEISPKYLMKLIDSVDKAIWYEYNSYKYVLLYIGKWYESDINGGNFFIHTKDQGNIDLASTLHSMDGDLLLKIAIDLGVDTPDYIPSIPTFKNTLKVGYNTAFDSFNKAIKEVEDHTDVAIGLANSTLESIIKVILHDDRINIEYKKNKTLYSLSEDILKEFKMFPESDMPEEIKRIGSSLLKLSQSIEALRSEQTKFHGKISEDYIIDDPMYAYFVINSISTVGMFLISYFEKKYPKTEATTYNFDDDEVPF